MSRFDFEDPRKAFIEAEKRIRNAHKSGGTFLDLSSLGLTEIPDSVGELRQLQTLHAHLNRLTNLPSSADRLTQITSLRLDDNEFTRMPDCIAGFTRISGLYVDGNRLSELPEWIGQLERLQVLSLSENSIKSLPGSFRQLKKLQRLSLSINQLGSLPEWFGELSEVRDLYLFSNRLQKLPRSLEPAAGNLRHLFLHNNLLEIPPEVLGPTYFEVTEEGKTAARPGDILHYYFRANKIPLNEAKLILLGEGGVGKTSLVNRLVHHRFEDTTVTHGINITQWQVSGKKDQTRLNIWDFGGQEVQRGTHQFFLTERTIYLIVLNGRTGDEDLNAEYWLKFVRVFGTSAPPDDKTPGETSPVIMVLNKFDDEPFQLNQTGLQRKYDFIKGFVKTDCKTKEHKGIDELTAKIGEVLGGMKHVREGFPEEWHKIKNRLADMTQRRESHIPFTKYRKICEGYDEKDPDAQERLARVLNALGIALNFRDDPNLREEAILDPRWITDGFYKIVTNKRLMERHGEMRPSDLREILPAKAYPGHMLVFLVDLMRKFELCFPYYEDEGQNLNPNEQRYLVPQLLSKEEPNLRAAFLPEACFNFRYDYYALMPSGLIPRFITRTHTMSQPEGRWRSGVVLKWGDCRALVKADFQDRQIVVRVVGEQTPRSELLAIIRQNFDQVHSDLNEFKPREWIALNGHPDEWILVSELERLEEGKVTEFPKATNDGVLKVKVTELLNQADVPGGRRKSDRSIAARGPLKVFLSYAHEDEKWRDLLLPHFELLERDGFIDLWCDFKIRAGENWPAEIKHKLEAAELYVFLISTDLLNSDFVRNEEWPIARERHNQKFARIVPVIVKKSLWESFVEGIQVLPTGGKPLSKYRPYNDGCVDVAQGLRKTIDDLRNMQRTQ